MNIVHQRIEANECKKVFVDVTYPKEKKKSSTPSWVEGEIRKIRSLKLKFPGMKIWGA